LTDYSTHPRMAIGADGIIYVTNGGFANGALFSFNPDLTLRWSTQITNVNVGGPAIGNNGTLVVCGVGTDVRAYEGGTGIAERTTDYRHYMHLEVSPNPFSRITDITYAITDDISSAGHGHPELKIYDVNGRIVRDFSVLPSVIGHQSSVQWDGSNTAGRQVPHGVYFVNLVHNGHRVAEKILYIK